MHHSLCLLLCLMQVRSKVFPVCDQPPMNRHTQSGIYDLAQTPSGEIIRIDVLALTFIKALCLLLLRLAKTSLILWLHRNGFIK